MKGGILVKLHFIVDLNLSYVSAFFFDVLD